MTRQNWTYFSPRVWDNDTKDTVVEIGDNQGESEITGRMIEFAPEGERRLSNGYVLKYFANVDAALHPIKHAHDVCKWVVFLLLVAVCVSAVIFALLDAFLPPGTPDIPSQTLQGEIDATNALVDQIRQFLVEQALRPCETQECVLERLAQFTALAPYFSSAAADAGA